MIPNEQESEEGMYPSIDDEDEYDLEPEEDELDDDDVSDELDDIEDPRVTEILSEEDEKAPALVKKEEAKKGKKKRQAEDSGDEPSNLDEIMAKSLKSDDKDVQGEQKLSKKQLKKLKKNDGKAVDATAETKPAKSEDAKEKSDKKVSFAKNLEQPPTSSQSKVNGDKKQETPKTGVKVVQGVKIDDRKVGSGPVAKKGDKVGMRYIGKLKDGKVFDGMCTIIKTERQADRVKQTKRVRLSSSSLEKVLLSKAGTLELLAWQSVGSVGSLFLQTWAMEIRAFPTSRPTPNLLSTSKCLRFCEGGPNKMR